MATQHSDQRKTAPTADVPAGVRPAAHGRVFPVKGVVRSRALMRAARRLRKT